MTSTSTTHAGTASGLRRRWPTLAGIAVAAMTAFGLATGSDLAPILAASGLVYLGAAALRKPVAAWWVFLGTFVVVGAGKAVGEAAFATWLILGLAGAFALYGVVRGALRPAYGLPLQSLAMLAFGAVAAVALAVNQSAGAYLVAAGLLGHAAWDVYHHRVNRVVVRSLAEFCVVLDTLLAVVIVVITVRG